MEIKERVQLLNDLSNVKTNLNIALVELEDIMIELKKEEQTNGNTKHIEG